MENNYMIIFSKGVRVPLLAKDGVYKLKCGRSTIEIPAVVERWMVTYYYNSPKPTESICRWVRDNYEAGIATKTLDLIIKQFTQDHISQPYSISSVDDVPIYATETEGLELPLPLNYTPNSLFIDRQTEQQWVGCIFERGCFGVQNLEVAIAQYRARYGISVSKSDKWDQDRDISDAFLEQHGMSRTVSDQEVIGHIQLTEAYRHTLHPPRLWWKLGKTVCCLFLGWSVINHYMNTDIYSSACVWDMLAYGFALLLVFAAIVTLWDTWAPPELRSSKKQDQH